MIRANIPQAIQASDELARRSRMLSRYLRDVRTTFRVITPTQEQRAEALSGLAERETAVKDAMTVYATITQATTQQPFPYGDPGVES